MEVRKNCNSRCSMRAAIGHESCIDAGTLCPHFDILNLPSLRLIRFGRMCVEGFVELFTRIWELHGRDGALVEVFQLPIRVRYRRRRSDNFRASPNTATGLKGNNLPKWLGDLFKDRVQRRLKQSSKRPKRLIKQVCLVLDE